MITPLICLFMIVATALLLAQHARGFRAAPMLRLANLGTSQHAGNISKKADAALATRYLLVKIGSDADHVAVAGAADIPLGVCTDEPPAAEDWCNVALFGSIGTTLPMVASAAIAAGDFVVSAANGKIRALPAAAATYYIIGRALEAASGDGVLIEVDPIPPTQRVVT